MRVDRGAREPRHHLGERRRQELHRAGPRRRGLPEADVRALREAQRHVPRAERGAQRGARLRRARPLREPDLLILDDFFTTPIENPLNAVDLFEILEAREGRGSTMSASQLEPDQWYPRINSELCADSILSRAVEHARALDIKGPNMREHTASLKAESDKGYWD